LQATGLVPVVIDMVFTPCRSAMDSIDFDFLVNNDNNDDTNSNALRRALDRDPRVVRSIGDVADNAEGRLASRQARNTGIQPDGSELDFDILSLNESDLESLWPAWGERRVASLGRGIPTGITITPQYLPKSEGAIRPVS